MSKKKFHVSLTEKERQKLQAYANTGTHSARSIKRARILLLAHNGESDPTIAKQVGVCLVTVFRIRRRYCNEGLKAALQEKARPGAPRKFSGRDEAKITLLACSQPPEGYQRWTVRLLADRLVRLEYVESISHMTVQRLQKKNELKPWQKLQWCISRITSGFLMRMEDVLDLYELPYDPLWPRLCFDERPCQLLGDLKVPIPMQPGKSYKYDYHYERLGVCNLFVAVEPLTGFRFAKVYSHRTKIEYANFMKELVELPRYAGVHGFKLVQDNLNTHEAGSFYQAFEPELARQLKKKFEYHYTPTNGSWLNMAEIELAAISKQCLNRRIPSQELLEKEVLACVKERNEKEIKITWRFTTHDAREKLERHYNTIKN